MYLYKDQKPLLYLWGCREKSSHRFFRYQIVISQFQNLKIIWTEGKNLAFPDNLIKNVSIKNLDNYQLKHKKIPKNIKFYDESGNEEKYFVLHDNEKGQKNDCYLILKQTFQGVKKVNFENEQFFSDSP